MALEDLPGEFLLLTRDEIARRYRRDYRLRNPGALVGDGTQPDLDAKLIADVLAPLYADAKLIADGVDDSLAVGGKLDRAAAKWGLLRAPPRGASGSVVISASTTGGTIYAGDEIKEPSSGKRYQCAVTSHYTDGASVPVVGKDTGPGTNQAAGTVMQWTTPRPGIGSQATVYEDVNGAGIIGGADQETDAQLQGRIQERKANPPIDENDAQIQTLIGGTPGVAVEKAFTYPCILGPGMLSYVFTVRPNVAGGSRIPNSTQIATVQAHLAGSCSADFTLVPAQLVAEDLDISLTVLWDGSVPGWADAYPWPVGYATNGGAIIVHGATDATHFTLRTDNHTYSGIADPVVGQQIAFYDVANATWRRKTLLTVAGSGPWIVVCATVSNASDVTYTPSAGQPVSPWSDSLDSLMPAVLGFLDTMGPGEQSASPIGQGRRMYRSPPSPRHWPARVTNDLISRRGVNGAGVAIPALPDTAGVGDVAVFEGLGTEASIGEPAALSYILQLHWLAIYASTAIV